MPPKPGNHGNQFSLTREPPGSCWRAKRKLLSLAILCSAHWALAQSYQPAKCMPPPNDSYFQSRGIHAYPGFTYNLGGEHAQFSDCQGLPPTDETEDHDFDSTAR